MYKKNSGNKLDNPLVYGLCLGLPIGLTCGIASQNIFVGVSVALLVTFKTVYAQKSSSL